MFEISPDLISNISYVFVFVGAVIEGETVLLLSSFAASLGYLNIWAVLGLVFLGEVIADACWYWVGRLAKDNVLHRIERWFKVSPALLARLEHYFEHHSAKILIGFKFVVGLRLATLIAAGLARMPFRKFLALNIFSIGLWTLLFGGIGFFFGENYKRISATFEQVGIVFLLLIVGLVILEIVAGKKYTKRYLSQPDPDFIAPADGHATPSAEIPRKAEKL